MNIKPSMKTEICGNVMSLLKGKDNFKTADATSSTTNSATIDVTMGEDDL